MENIRNGSHIENDSSKTLSSPHKLSTTNLLEASERHNEVVMVNKSWYNRLLYVQLKAIQMQYYLACYNTMGGAYHLCEQPKSALIISKKQEILARQIGSLPLLFRALGYQYTNIGLMGYPNKATKKLNHLIQVAEREHLVELVHFLQANLAWMQQHLLFSQKPQSESESLCTQSEETSNE